MINNSYNNKNRPGGGMADLPRTKFAEMAELADALVSRTSESNLMGVRLSLSAQKS